MTDSCFEIFEVPILLSNLTYFASDLIPSALQLNKFVNTNDDIGY